MPKLGEGLDTFKASVGAYGFSAAKIDELGATEYTLVTIAVDTSGSVMGYKDDLEKTVKEIVKSCKHSPRADNLLIRLTEFNSKVVEIHGFKPLEHCNVDDYTDAFRPRGVTALMDASENAARATSEYGATLTKSDFDVNGILFVLTDGFDNNSTMSVNQVKDAFLNATQEESVESLVSVLIGVGVGLHDKQNLEDFKSDVGFTQFISTTDASSRTLAKLAQFVSQSISSQSQSLGSGSASQAVQSLAI